MVYQKIWDRARLFIYPNIARGPCNPKRGGVGAGYDVYTKRAGCELQQAGQINGVIDI